MTNDIRTIADFIGGALPGEVNWLNDSVALVWCDHARPLAVYEAACHEGADLDDVIAVPARDASGPGCWYVGPAEGLRAALEDGEILGLLASELGVTEDEMQEIAEDLHAETGGNELADAIERSRSHDEIVTIEVADPGAARAEIAALYSGEIDSVLNGDTLEVWGWTDAQAEDQMDFRVHLRAPSRAHKASVDVFGDALEVTWDGNVWVTSVGAQYAHRSDAMRDELEAYFRSCGEDITDPEIAEQIDALLTEITE